MSKRTGWFIAILGATVISGYFIWLNKYNIYDWLVLRNYTPSSQVSKLADMSGMGDYGRRLFYINDPEISPKSTFANQCLNAEQTIVLGCYTGSNIYIHDVTEAQLEGVEEVTAAHEMLHAAYDRLSSKERSRVDKLVDDAYKRINNPRIIQLADSYRKQDPTIVPNELHSILGTEVRNLGPELEAYYAKYFYDRTKVLALSEQYEKVFEDLKNSAEKLGSELSIRKAEIDDLAMKLENQAGQLSDQKSKMDSYSNTGQIESYNALVNPYNASVNSYNSGLQRYRKLVSEYNLSVEKYNAIATQQTELTKSLDTRLSPISQ